MRLLRPRREWYYTSAAVSAVASRASPMIRVYMSDHLIHHFGVESHNMIARIAARAR